MPLHVSFDGISDIVHSTLLMLNILQIMSILDTVKYLGNWDSLGSHCYDLPGRSGAEQSRAAFSPLLRKDLPECFAPCPVNDEFFSLTAGSGHYSQAYVGLRLCCPLSFWVVPSSISGSFSSCISYWWPCRGPYADF